MKIFDYTFLFCKLDTTMICHMSIKNADFICNITQPHTLTDLTQDLGRLELNTTFHNITMWTSLREKVPKLNNLLQRLTNLETVEDFILFALS